MPAMTMEEFDRLAAAHGGDLGRWPAAQAARAARLVEEAPEARATLADAAALDEALAEAVEGEAAPDALLARVMGDAASVAADRAAPAPVSTTAAAPGWLERLRAALRPSPEFAAACAMAGCAALGVFIGYSADPGLAPLAALSAQEAEEGLDGLEDLDLAFGSELDVLESFN